MLCIQFQPVDALSEWLGNLPALTSTSLGILVLLPADRIHRIASLTGSHDNTQVIRRSREIVIRLIAQGDLKPGQLVCTLSKRSNIPLPP